MTKQISTFLSNSKNIYLLIIVGVVILVSVLYILTRVVSKDVANDTNSNTSQQSNSDSNESNTDAEEISNTNGDSIPGVQEPEPPQDIIEQTLLPIN